MKALIVGCGWLGQQIAVALQQQGYVVAGTRRSPAALAQLPTGVGQICWDGASAWPEDLLIAVRDSWLICAMPPSASTDGGAGYLATLRQICALAPLSKGLVLCSSTGVYSGLSGVVTEGDSPGPSPRAALLWQAEQLVLAQPHSYVLRLAGLVGPGRHPAGFCRHGPLSGPDDPVNLVHSEDICRFLCLLLTKPPVTQVFNLRAPITLTKQQFYTAACQQAGQPVPGFKPALMAGHQVDGSATGKLDGFYYKFTDLAQLPT